MTTQKLFSKQREELLVAALRECMRDTFTAAKGMSESGKRSPAAARYRQAIAALEAVEGQSERNI